MKTRKVKILAYPPKYAMGGSAGVAIQAEDDEMFVMPDMQIVESAALKKHKDMKKHEISDIMPPEGSFVFSDSDKNLLDLKKIKDLEVVPKVSFFKEGSKTKTESLKLIDFLPKNKNKITYAEAARSIADKVKLVDLEDNNKNGYIQETNNSNKELRAILLSKLAELQEVSKVKKGLTNGEVPMFAEGGPPGYEDILSDYKRKLTDIESELRPNYDQSVQDYSNLYTKLNTLNATSLLANTAFVGMQDTKVEPAYSSASGADEMFKTISPAAMKNYSESRRGFVNSLADQYLRAGADPAKVSAMLSPLSGKLIDEEGRSAMDNLREQVSMDRQKASFLNQIENKNIQEGASAMRATQDNVNKSIGLLGQGVDSYLDNVAKTSVGKVKNLRSALNEYNTGRLSLLQSQLGLDTTGADYNIRKQELDEKRRQFDEMLKSQQKPGATTGSSLPKQVTPLNTTLEKKISDRIGKGISSLDPKGLFSVKKPAGLGFSSQPKSSSNYKDVSGNLMNLYSKAMETKDLDDYNTFLTEVRKYVPADRYAALEKDNFKGLAPANASLDARNNGEYFPTLYVGDEPLIPFDYKFD